MIGGETSNVIASTDFTHEAAAKNQREIIHFKKSITMTHLCNTEHFVVMSCTFFCERGFLRAFKFEAIRLYISAGTARRP